METNKKMSERDLEIIRILSNNIVTDINYYMGADHNMSLDAAIIETRKNTCAGPTAWRAAMSIIRSQQTKKKGYKMKLRITAKTENCRKYAVVCLGVKVAVAFSRDSGAKIAYGARMLEGEISSGGSRQNWYCCVSEGSVFEIEVDTEIYNRNKNRIKKWDMQEIEEFSITEERSRALQYASDNLE